MKLYFTQKCGGMRMSFFTSSTAAVEVTMRRAICAAMVDVQQRKSKMRELLLFNNPLTITNRSLCP